MSVLDRIVMPETLIAYLKSVLGFDTTETRVYEITKYLYKIETNSGERTVEGYSHQRSGSTLQVFRPDRDTWALGTIVGEPVEAYKPPFGGGFEEIETVEEIIDFEREALSEEEWGVVVNVGTVEIEEVRVPDEFTAT